MKKFVINVLLTVLVISLILIGNYIDNPDYTQILNIAAVVVGLWLIMRIFNIKRLVTKD